MQIDINIHEHEEEATPMGPRGDFDRFDYDLENANIEVFTIN
jgi:hypothetical protein